MDGTITIGDQTYPLEEATEHWITDQISRRQREGAAICVRVAVTVGSVTLNLATPACPAGSAGGGGRPPNASEQKVFDLWNERNLNTRNFSGGNVIAFLKQLRKLV